ncbi:hypothetical protein DSM106972_089540 [Dulcicalothrix desertica PCC 7102]|uniref:Uncharacterized protein n=1 Tax=Dulcicalothrix desertica PCC 7102 TaxID=232991 RepID=A0A433UP31_9CYAN|nr:hypothetical protein [Dulcicalothrix desertica]RUS95598.1 hypothetical protein DSM106972_089540 [Dulcicalothrix desertica PCC 7102]TWH39933.1 hypothetical protein CAL7102_09213 [Dulcicalothrix desertica PCC 7102]
MSGCEAYQIVPLKRFETSLKKVIKSHYRKNERARSSFLELVDYYIEQLRENPGSNPFSEDESFPKGCYDSKFKFRKIKFKTPELDGAAGCGRLMYVLCEEKCTVYLVWVYTHEEFEKRPPEDDLRSEFTTIQENVEES